MANVYVPLTPVTTLTQGEQCRNCGRLTFMADEKGPLHRCCVMWAAAIATTGRCPSCEAGKAGWRKFNGEAERRKQWNR